MFSIWGGGECDIYCFSLLVHYSFENHCWLCFRFDDPQLWRLHSEAYEICLTRTRCQNVIEKSLHIRHGWLSSSLLSMLVWIVVTSNRTLQVINWNIQWNLPKTKSSGTWLFFHPDKFLAYPIFVCEEKIFFLNKINQKWV